MTTVMHGIVYRQKLFLCVSILSVDGLENIWTSPLIHSLLFLVHVCHLSTLNVSLCSFFQSLSLRLCGDLPSCLNSTTQCCATCNTLSDLWITRVTLIFEGFTKMYMGLTTHRHFVLHSSIQMNTVIIFANHYCPTFSLSLTFDYTGIMADNICNF